MKLSFLLFLAAYNFYSIQGQIEFFFIGQGSNSLYFGVRSRPYEWDWGLNYCHLSRLMPGSIANEADHELITNFLNTSTQIEDDNRFLWLAATDHRIEGTFQWLWNMENVTLDSWAPGMPSLNRTANCLAINRKGQLMEESCYNSGRRHYSLCEAAMFRFGNEEDDVPNQINHHNTNIAKTHNLLTFQAPPEFTVIGQVGDKLYFVNNEEQSWSEAIDLCHSADMRLATPEEPEQLDYIHQFALEQWAIYYLGGTDRLSVSCLRTNYEFRWFYSGNAVANQTNLTGANRWYLCTFMSPVGLFTTGCSNGGGTLARPICEITVET